MGRMVIGADKERNVLARRALYERGAHLSPDVGQACSRAGQGGADLVAFGRQMPEQDLPAVGPAPAKEIAILVGFGAEAAPQDAVLETEFVRDRGKYRGMAERIRRVQHVESSAETFRIRRAEQQVADQRLPRRDQLVGEHIPGTDLQASRLHERLHVVLALGTRAQVVLDEHRLAIEQERPEGRVGVHAFDQFVEHQNQARVKCGTREKPLPVPMGVRNEMKDERRHGFSCDSSAVLERCTWATRRPRASRARMSPRAWA